VNDPDGNIFTQDALDFSTCEGDRKAFKGSLNHQAITVALTTMYKPKWKRRHH